MRGAFASGKDGRWEGRYTAGHTPEGKAIYRNVLGKTQAEVVEKLRKAIEETKGLDVAKAGQYTMGQWMRVWYENYATIKVRPSSHATYRGIIKNHIDPAIGNIPLTKLTTLDLQKFYRDLLTGGRVERKESEKKPKGLGPKTVRNIHQIISSALKLAIHQKLIAHNPAEGCALPRVERNEMKTLTADQLTAFLQEAERTGVFEMYYLELATGLRRGELLGLKWQDVDFNQGTVTVRAADRTHQRCGDRRTLENQERLPGDSPGQSGFRGSKKPEGKASQRVCVPVSQRRANQPGQRAEYASPGAETGRAALCALP